MARPRKASAEIETIEQANNALYRLLIHQVELEKQRGAADIERAAATARYEAAIERQQQQIADLTLQLQTWYMGRTKELEQDGRKSIQLSHGVVGRRMGNPTLKPLNRAWTWTAIGVQLRAMFGGRFFRAAEPEIDKDLVKAKLTDEQLREVGLKVEQDEKFFIEIDRSSLGENAC